MDIIETKIDKKSETYRKNVESMQALSADLRQALKIAAEDRSQKALEREKNSGQTTRLEKAGIICWTKTPLFWKLLLWLPRTCMTAKFIAPDCWPVSVWWKEENASSA